MNCVVCGKPLAAARTHVDTCGERCFKRLLATQRQSYFNPDGTLRPLYDEEGRPLTQG